jgi:hypothetical protein
VVQGTIQWRRSVKTSNFLTRWVTISFWKRTLLHGVSLFFFVPPFFSFLPISSIFFIVASLFNISFSLSLRPPPFLLFFLSFCVFLCFLLLLFYFNFFFFSVIFIFNICLQFLFCTIFPSFFVCLLFCSFVSIFLQIRKQTTEHACGALLGGPWFKSRSEHRLS